MTTFEQRLQEKNKPGISPETENATPVFFHPAHADDRKALSGLLAQKPFIRLHDTIHNQLAELVKTLHPSQKFSNPELEEAVKAHLNGCLEWAYGVWVYYPWNERLVHIVDKEEFIILRTNRNKYKITDEERDILATKKIGVIGLSVGQSVALTLAMERGFGELRIADFDTLELTNLNRLRAGIHQLGLKKTVLVTREIAEIDPFLKVTCFPQGITEGNIEAFFHEGGTLDVLIDECDSLDIKILCRQKARACRIPVLMDTSDRGMIDIERFDLESERGILHGLVGEINKLSTKMDDPEQRIKMSVQIAGGNSLSERLKTSIPQIGKTITTWPQLASSVILGGAVIAEACRKILLKNSIPSGRFYIDPHQIIQS